MLRIPVLCVVALCCGLGVAPAATGQAARTDEVPEGLTAADWSGIKAAYEANRHAIDPDEERGARSALNIGSIAQQAYTKASNTDGGDWFGFAVAVSGDTVVVGAYLEDSNATGVNGNESDNSATWAGAAYVFNLGFGASAWIDWGCGLAGVSGNPLLVGTGTLADGSSNSIDLSNAAPSATCRLFVALSSTPVPFKGGTLKPVPFLIDPIILATSAAGTLPLPFTQPSGLPSGTTLWFQYGIQDAAAIFGVSLSNAVVGSTP